jgi:hypothetical protein
MSADKVIPFTTLETCIAIGFLVVCVVGFVPAVKNFRVVLKDKNNPKITPAGRKFVLFYLGVGVICIVLMFVLSVYSLVLRT